MKNAPYWTAVVLGMLAVLIVYLIVKQRQLKQESFVDASTATATYYEGDSASIPFQDKLYVYLSSFSGTQSDHLTATFSGSGVPMWRSLVNEDVYFHVVGTNLPSTIEGGLPMLGTRLLGPPSENAALANTNYVLPSFTAAWFAKWKSLDFDTDAPIVLLRMFAENPNHVQISVRQIDSTTVSFDVVVGNANSVYSWSIPKTTLLSQGNGTLYAFVYNREEKKISFNIGSTIKYPRVLTETAIIKLGNTPMDLNYNQNWAADLKAFMFYRTAVSDFASLHEYLSQQASGVKLLETTTQAEKAVLEESLLSEQDLASLRDELDLTRQQLYANRLQLRQCQQKPESIDPKSFRRWQLKDGMYPGTYDKLNQCKELNIDDLDAIKSRLSAILIKAFAGPIDAAVSSAVNTKTPLYTTFPNASFKKLSDPSIYVPTPYPDKAATAKPFQLNTLITQFGQQPPSTIAEAQLLPTAPVASASTPATATPIPEAQVLPRPESSTAGVTLLYADPSAGETVKTADATTTIPNPNLNTLLSDSATTASTTNLDTSLWEKLKSLLA